MQHCPRGDGAELEIIAAILERLEAGLEFAVQLAPRCSRCSPHQSSPSRAEDPIRCLGKAALCEAAKERLRSA